MALLIRSNGTVSNVFPKGGTFTLQEMYDLIGCSIVEPVSISHGQIMWVDEEGLLKNLRLNFSATQIANQAIVGNILITWPNEIKVDDE